jgi:hypothetical protein
MHLAHERTCMLVPIGVICIALRFVCVCLYKREQRRALHGIHMYIFQECVLCAVCALLAAAAENFNARWMRQDTRRADFHRASARARFSYIYFNSRGGDLITCLLAVCQHKTVMCITLSRSVASPWALIHTAYILSRSTPWRKNLARTEESAAARRVSKVSRLFHTLRVAIIV